jgi:hypothetical protein
MPELLELLDRGDEYLQLKHIAAYFDAQQANANKAGLTEAQLQEVSQSNDLLASLKTQ